MKQYTIVKVTQAGRFPFADKNGSFFHWVQYAKILIDDAAKGICQCRECVGLQKIEIREVEHLSDLSVPPVAIMGLDKSLTFPNPDMEIFTLL